MEDFSLAKLLENILLLNIYLLKKLLKDYSEQLYSGISLKSNNSSIGTEYLLFVLKDYWFTYEIFPQYTAVDYILIGLIVRIIYLQ